ncbi:MAG: NUDIX hydrolase [Patescibacteria group bacterium]
MSRNVLVGVGVIIVQDSKTLLTKRQGSHGEGSYGSIGGHLEFGETPIDALKREAMEELGVELENINFRVATNMIKYGKHYLDLTFTASIKSGVPFIKEPEKITELAWFELNNLPTPLFEPVRIGLESLNTGQKYFEVKE